MALVSFSKRQLLNMLRSAALLCPIGYVGLLTSPLARNAADNFIAEVDCLLHKSVLTYPTGRGKF